MLRSLSAVVVWSVVGAASAGSATPAWVAQSNEYAQIPLAISARYFPEDAARTGFAGVDGEIIDLRRDVYDRYVADARKAAIALRTRLAGVEEPHLRQDLEIMIKAEDDFVTTAQVRRRLLLEFIDIGQIEFEGIRSLLDPQIAKDRQAAALVRLRRYAGFEPGTTPLARLAIERTEERLAVPGLTGPYVNEVDKALGDADYYIAGMRDMFRASGLDGWQEPLSALEKQLDDYNAWVRAHLVPRCRAGHRLPPEIYADNLKQMGVDVQPEVLIDQAQFSFAEIRNQLRALALQVAKMHGFPSADYRDVLRELKKDQLVGDAIMPLYRARLAEIERIIVRERIVTLPQRQASIRLATPAETAQTPAPHLLVPRLIGNDGEYGEFVLPLNLPGKSEGDRLRFDDDTVDAASWTLTAHEARPGHEVQFASMIERGVSIARAVFADNAVNAEGWALYAEAELQPYEPPEGQLFALQARLLRAARAFLDPMLNLGLTTPERAAEVLGDDVVLSKAMVKQEVDRYTFWGPGQAASYYYGYFRLMQIRAKTELALGARFDRQKFNDFVLSQGLLPPRLLQKAVETEFIPREAGTLSSTATR